MPVSLPFTGGCLCQAVRYECTAAPLHVYYCYCRDCQKAGGGPFASCIVVPPDAVTVQGAPKAYTITAESGSQFTREFCGECGSPLFSHKAERTLDFLVVKIGSMDDPTWLTPTMHIWTDSAWPWVQIEDNLPRFAKDPEL